jgi:predicted TIM-barrel fold metal-dependent hydrolase
MIIDVHAHYYPARCLDLIGRPDLPPRAAAELARQSIGERLDLLDRAGIDTQILSVSQAQPYLPGSRAAAAAAAVANDLYADLCQAHPGRFYAFAALPLPHVGESLAELARDRRQPVGRGRHPQRQRGRTPARRPGVRAGVRAGVRRTRPARIGGLLTPRRPG